MVALAFNDNARVTINPLTRFEVVTWKFDRADRSKSNVFLKLIAGAVRVTTGLIGSRSRNGSPSAWRIRRSASGYRIRSALHGKLRRIAAARQSGDAKVPLRQQGRRCTAAGAGGDSSCRPGMAPCRSVPGPVPCVSPRVSPSMSTRRAANRATCRARRRS